jgi:hypothetical protein
MQINYEKRDFKPITIVFDSEEELDTFYSLVEILDDYQTTTFGCYAETPEERKEEEKKERDMVLFLSNNLLKVYE